MGHTRHHPGLPLDEELIAREAEEDRARREADDESPPGSLL
jgi:hypothetical protein